ncbi:MAG: hypothetical protein ABI134_17415 [Byssovorax sp.]
MRNLSVLGLVLVAGCLFDPQPDPPGNNDSDAGTESGATGSAGGTTDGAGP